MALVQQRIVTALSLALLIGAAACSSSDSSDDGVGAGAGAATANEGGAIPLGDVTRDAPKELVLAEAGKPGDSVTFTVDKIDAEHKVVLEVWGHRNADGHDLQRTEVKVEFEDVSTSVKDSNGVELLLDLSKATSTLKLTNMVKEDFDMVTHKSLGPASMQIRLWRVRVATEGTDWCRMGVACDVPTIHKTCANGQPPPPGKCMAPRDFMMIGDQIRSISSAGGGKITSDNFGWCKVGCDK